MENPKVFPCKVPLDKPGMGPAGGLDDISGAVTCKGDDRCSSDFPETYGPFGAWLEGGRPPLTEGEGVVSPRCPPRGKLDWDMTERSRPSEHRERDCGGLSSSTRNCERSRLACRGTGSAGDAMGDATGIHDDSCTHLGEGTLAFGGSPDGDGEDTGGTEAFGGSPEGDGEGA